MRALSIKQADQAVIQGQESSVKPAPVVERGEPERARMSEAQVDQLLVERVQKGEKQAFDLLIIKYQHRIISLVSRYVGDQAGLRPADHQIPAQDNQPGVTLRG
jgi:hypothetical protein